MVTRVRNDDIGLPKRGCNLPLDPLDLLELEHIEGIRLGYPTRGANSVDEPRQELSSPGAQRDPRPTARKLHHEPLADPGARPDYPNHFAI
jgi:hypothetical protein